MTTTGSFAKLATVTASTKRTGAVVDGLSGDPVAVETDFACTPLDPVTPDVAAMAGLEHFAEVLQTLCEGGLDILEGDQFIAGGVTYKVRAVAQWHWRPADANTLHVFVEETK